MEVNGIHVRLELSHQELRVALLTQKGFGRNAIAAALGLSPNSVKTLLARIRDKLGARWRTDPRIWWPADEEITPPAVAGNLDLENRWQDAYEAHAASLGLLIQQSRGQTVFKVSGAQRFWLKPALAKLVDRKYLRLLKVDWQDVYAPPWLPVLNRGRKAIRAATYNTSNPRLVRGSLQDYLHFELLSFFSEVSDKLSEAGKLVGMQEAGAVISMLKSALNEAFPEEGAIAS